MYDNEPFWCANYRIILTFKRDQKGSFISNRFLKTNLRKFAVMWVKRRQKAGFLSPRSSKITGKGKGEKEGARRRKRWEEKKGNGCILSFSVIATLEIVFGRKKLLDAKGPFRDNVFKIRVDIHTKEYINGLPLRKRSVLNFIQKFLLLFIQNIPPFLIASNSPPNSS